MSPQSAATLWATIRTSIRNRKKNPRDRRQFRGLGVNLERLLATDSMTARESEVSERFLPALFAVFQSF